MGSNAGLSGQPTKHGIFPSNDFVAPDDVGGLFINQIPGVVLPTIFTATNKRGWFPPDQLYRIPLLQLTVGNMFNQSVAGIIHPVYIFQLDFDNYLIKPIVD